MDSLTALGVMHALMVDDLSSAWVQRGKVKASIDEIMLAHLEMPPHLADPDDKVEEWGTDPESQAALQGMLKMRTRS